jgi:osmotically-inducible protein OsmY
LEILTIMLRLQSPVPTGAVSPLAAEVTQQLAGTGRLRLRSVQVNEANGTVILSGRVPTFYLKQLAQTIAGSVGGVATIRNEVVVSSAS